MRIDTGDYDKICQNHDNANYHNINNEENDLNDRENREKYELNLLQKQRRRISFPVYASPELAQ